MRKTIYIVVLFICTILMTINPVHSIEPTINGPDIVFKQSTSIITINDILLLYQSDGRFISASEDGYTGNGATVGVYNVVLSATDGISTIHRTIQVKVLSEVGDVTLVGNGDLYVRPDQALDFTKIRTVLRNVGYISTPVGTGYQMLLDQYTGNESTVGVYDYQFRLISSSGYIQNVNIKIYVSEDFTQFNNEDIIPGEPSAFNGIWKTVSNLFWTFVVMFVAFILVKFIFFRKKKGSF